MKKTLLTYCLLLLTFTPLWATAGTGEGEKKDKASKETASVPTPVPAALATRQFAELEHYFEEEAVVDEPEFLPEGPVFSNDPIDSAKYFVAKAQEAIEQVRSLRKFIGYLDGESLLDLPVGIHKEIGGHAYDIAITDIRLKPQYAELEVYMQFTVPQNGKVLTFRGTGIKFTKAGGIVGDAALELVTDYTINLDGDKSQIVLKGGGNSVSGTGTFAKFDCSGFLEMGLDAQVKFSRDLLVPEDVNGNPTNGNVEASFGTVIKSWNDLIVQIDMPAFQVTSLEGVGITVRDAVFDFSDHRNAPAVKFPEGYQSPAILSGTPNLWRGFYLRELSVRLPQQFEKQGSTARTSFAAYDVLIDNMGFSGLLEGKALINTGEGNMSGWSYSLDSLGIALEANQIKQAGFNGDLVIPIANEQRPFEYTALINPGNEYIFNVEAAEDMQFDVFKTSSVEIYEASYLEIKVAEGKFRPKANLHGRMDINAPMSEGSSSQSAQLAAITFENLQLQTVKPYLQVGDFSFGSEAAEQAMANFPVSINNIGLRTVSETEVGLDFNLIVNLNESFGGEAGLTILGNLSDNGEGQRWRYKKLQVNDISVDIDQGAFKFYGRLQFFRDDDVYGNGFNGVIDATFNPGIKVQATAIFGAVNGTRFWYADALASFPTAIPVVPPFGINGFGGGAYYHMKMDNEGIGSDYGRTASGTVYVPDGNAGLGLKATIAFATVGSESVINGDATYEMAFYTGGGLRSITFTGNMFIVTPPIGGEMLARMEEKTQKMVEVVEKYENSMAAGILPDDPQTIKEIHGQIGAAAGKRGSISAHVKIVLDFENRSLHANMEMYVNVAGGIIKGVGPGGRAGWAVLHYGPDDWYFYLGTPEDRIGVSAGVGPIRAELTSYFMVGTKIPGSPPPPEIVSDILGGIDLDYMADENALGLGKGIGFGSAFSVDTGDLTFLIFYARFQAGLGFDIMLKNYGDNVRCKGRSDPLGINGWYANGQAYAYFDGKIGIRIRIFGKRRKIEILSIGAAAVLQAKLPNPFWMRGIVGGRFRVLGGLVKGNCRFEVTIGEECEIIGGSALQGVDVIAEVTPNDGQREVDVFSTPQVVFNMPVEKEFELIDVDDVKKKFRIKLDEFKLVSNGYTIPGDLEWNTDKDVVVFNAFDVFPSEEDVNVSAQVSFEEYTSGRWVPVFIDGKKYVEASNTKFTSGKAPDHIPVNNIEYSYPVLSQLNFYKDEYPSGYIKLKRGQPYLFEEDPDQWEQVGRLTNSSGAQSFFDYSYSTGDREVRFNLPENLQKGTIYALELVNLPAGDQGAIDRNVSARTSKLANEGGKIDTEITTKEAEGTISELQEQSIFGSYIRTSKFSTLREKLNTADMSQQWRWPIRSGVHELGKSIKAAELFDNAELNGPNGQAPMIQYEAVLTNNRYFDEYMYPITYQGYPLQGKFRVNWREEQPMGVPPARAVFIRQHPNTDLILTESDIASGQVITSGLSAAFIYNLSHYYQQDLSNLQNQVANYYADSGNVSQRLQFLLTSPFPRILGGPYDVKVRYVLPGKNIVASEQMVTITNPVE
ncbi:MAG: hypothetical protein AAF149_18380 [Bacteroidota bacterium]